MLRTLATACLIFFSVEVAQAASPPQGSWNEPVAISAAPASWIRSVTDNEGNVVAIWSLAGSLQASYCSAGGIWSSASRLAPAVDGYSLAIDSQGNALAVWGIEAERGFSICAASLPKGSSDWIALGKVTQQPTGGMEGFSPNVGFDGEGNAFVGWLNRSGDTYRFQSARLQAGSAQWSPLSDIYGIYWMNFPTLAVSKSGIAVVAWMDIEEDWSAYAARLQKNDTTWSTATKITRSFLPALGIDDVGNALVLCVAPGASSAGAYLLADSDTWETLEMPSESKKAHGWFTLAMNGAGEASVVWEGGTIHKSLLQTAHFSFAAKQWSTVTTLYSGPFVRYPSVAIDANGNSLCDWGLLQEGSSLLFVSTQSQGGRWSLPSKLPIAALDDDYRETTLAPNGTATVLYLQEGAVQAIQGTNLFQN